MNTNDTTKWNVSDILKKFTQEQSARLQQEQMREQMKQAMIAQQSQQLSQFVPGMAPQNVEPAFEDYAQGTMQDDPTIGMNEYGNGGYTVRRSNDRKGKTHVVTGPDGTKKYFGDPNMGERDKSKNGKEAFYARHATNLKNNPYFRAYARATWEEGGEMIKRADGSYSQRGLWDNIRANTGSGKEPTSAMLEQERKIQNARYGGDFGFLPNFF